MWHVLGLHRVSRVSGRLGEPCLCEELDNCPVWLQEMFGYLKLSFMESPSVVPTQKTQRERDPIRAVFFEKIPDFEWCVLHARKTTSWIL